MADALSAQLMNQLAQISAESLNQPVDWEARPDQPASGESSDGQVRIELRGFDVTGVNIDGEWLRGADQQSVEQAVQQAVGSALNAMVDAELERAQQTSYEAADVHTKLMKLSQEAGAVMSERIRTLGESV